MTPAGWSLRKGRMGIDRPAKELSHRGVPRKGDAIRQKEKVDNSALLVVHTLENDEPYPALETIRAARRPLSG